MIVSSNHRMVEGQPLHYYYSYNYHPPTVVLPEFPYFQQFDLYGYRSMEATDDLAMPGSPNSIQSDSDHSTSSVEVTLKEIKVKKPDGFYGPKATEQPGEKTQVKCCWHSCGLFFPTLDQLGNHVAKVHASGGPGGLYYCGWEGCSRNNKGFNARYKMLVHVRTHTNEKPHQCYQCDKSFSRAENLKIHSRSHSGEKPYVCPVPGCNKAYSNSSDRFKHTRTHQVDKPYQCKVPGCLKRYTDPSSLRKHVKTFKHFAENNHEIKEENRIQETDKMIDSKAEKTTCNCPHVCSMTDCLNKAAEMLRLGAMINLKKQDEESLSWNRFLDPYITPTKSIFHHTYVVDGQADMDVVDMPLDLSIHSKNI